MASAAAAVPRATWSERLVLWGPGMVVGLGAGVVTAHGLFVVATAAGVPSSIAWLYPIITDGLALVAYGATHRLKSRATIYAWTVVVLAAGLSGLAQAIYLAEDAVEVSQSTRFGVGAWPALAAAISAHLIFTLGRSAPYAVARSSNDRTIPIEDRPTPDSRTENVTRDDRRGPPPRFAETDGDAERRSEASAPASCGPVTAATESARVGVSPKTDREPARPRWPP